MKSSLSIFFLSIFLISCDPGRVLLIKTSGKPGASVAVYADSSMLPHHETDTTGKVVIQVPYMDTVRKHTKLYFYGIGNWPEERLGLFARQFDSIVIHTSKKGTIILKDSTSIHSYLLKHRSGPLNSILTIEAR